MTNTTTYIIKSDGLLSLGLTASQRGNASQFIAETTGKWFNNHYNSERSSQENIVEKNIRWDIIFKGSDLFDNVVRASETGGVIGATAKSKELLSNYDTDTKSNKLNKNENLQFIAGFEISAYTIAHILAMKNGSPALGYFSDQEITERLRQRFLKLGVGDSQFNKMFSEIESKLFTYIINKSSKRSEK
ncbi:MAG: hypothetical protein AB2L12_11310 [Smithellaceae bacterium]